MPTRNRDCVPQNNEPGQHESQRSITVVHLYVQWGRTTKNFGRIFFVKIVYRIVKKIVKSSAIGWYRKGPNTFMLGARMCQDIMVITTTEWIIATTSRTHWAITECRLWSQEMANISKSRLLLKLDIQQPLRSLM